MGGRIVRNLRRYGFSGSIHPVHPRAETVAGLAASRSVAEVGAVDLAMILVPSAAVPGAVADCAAAGVPNVIVGASGFAETGRDGAAVEAAMAAKLRAAGSRLWGPNTIGVTDLATGLIATFSPGLDVPKLFADPGGVAVISQSGGLAYGVAGLAAEAGLPVRWIATTGNESDMTASEVIADLAERADCDTVIAVLETPPAFDDVQRYAAADAEIVVLPIATGAAGTAHSVTAAHSAWRDLQPSQFADLAAAVRIVPGLPELFTTSDTRGAVGLPVSSSAPVRPSGPRIVVVTTSGGAGILAADAIEQHGAQLADMSDATRAALRERLPAYASIGNPLDVTATVITDPGLFTESLALVADDPQVDAILVCLCVLAEDHAALAAETIAGVRASGMPIAVVRTGATAHAPSLAGRLAKADVTIHAEPAAAVSALVSVSRAGPD